MENEREENINDKMIFSQNIFKLKYKRQALKRNAKFIVWKNKMLTIYGNNSKLFNCIYDDIYFYGTNDDYKTKPYYKSNCPICQKSICYYCSRYTKDNFDKGDCCIKRKIYCILVQDDFWVKKEVKYVGD